MPTAPIKATRIRATVCIGAPAERLTASASGACSRSVVVVTVAPVAMSADAGSVGSAVPSTTATATAAADGAAAAADGVAVRAVITVAVIRWETGMGPLTLVGHAARTIIIDTVHADLPAVW